MEKEKDKTNYLESRYAKLVNDSYEQKETITNKILEIEAEARKKVEELQKQLYILEKPLKTFKKRLRVLVEVGNAKIVVYSLRH